MKFKIFQKDYIPHLHRGIDRYAAVVAFNEGFYKLRSPRPTALSAVAFPRNKEGTAPTTKINFISNTVIEYIAHSEWVATYGLNYLETMQLTYSEWMRMQDQLNKKHIPALKPDTED